MSTPDSNLTPPEPKMLGVLAEFPGPDELVAAAEQTTDAGYRRVEAFSPFPIHGIDAALRAKKTILPWIVFFCGLTGCIVAQLMQHYMNGVEGRWMFSGYEYAISGKPYFSVPSSIPVTFEVIVLLSAFGAFFGMWALNQLPMLSNSLFRNERFKTATSHGFFLWVDAKDGKFNETDTGGYLQSIGAVGVDPVHQETAARDVPGLIHIVGAISTAVALVPPLWVAAAAGESSSPRLSIWWDMDYQPKFKAQTPTTLFADGRAMRTAVPGTVARGALTNDLPYYRGVNSEPDQVAAGPARGGELHFVSLLQNNEDESEDAEAEDESVPNDQESGDQGTGEAGTGEEGAGEGAATDPNAPPELDWATEFPERLEITNELMDRGEQRFNIYCATCHGLGGDGDGLITTRAMALQQGTWVQPVNLHTDDVRKQPVGKLFYTITNGIRRMPGYEQQISVEDRWAIVLYIKALQKQRTATAEEMKAAKAKRK